MKNLGGFDLSENETSLFSQFNNSAYYTGLLRNAGIPDDLSIENIGNGTQDDIPRLPGLYDITPTGVPGLLHVYCGSPYALSDHAVKADIIATVRRLQERRTVPTTTTELAEFVVFFDHTPFALTVSTEAIAAGFYRDLYALQGQRHTYYTGAAFDTHDSSLLWQFTESLLPQVVS